MLGASGRSGLIGLIGLGGWLALIVTAHVVGLGIVRRLPASRIFWPPLVARFRPDINFRLLLPLALALAGVTFGPAVARRLPWRWLLVAALAAAAAWSVALGASHGFGHLTSPLEYPNDYLRDVPLVGSPGPFLEGFTASIDRYGQHVRGHPPGMVLLLWAMGAIGLRGAGWEAALVITGGAAAVPAVLVALGDLAGQARARAAAPFLVLAPAAVYVATSADAFFAGVSAWAVALVTLSTGRTGRRGDLLALSGGLLFGATVYLSYGLTLLASIPLAVAAWRRRVRPLLVAGAGALIVAAAFTLSGFWWLAGLRASVREYRAGVSRARPQSYFRLGNLASFAIIVGPGAAMALGILRDRRVWVLVGAALFAVLAADLSGLSKGEVERIWLPFAPWVVAATAAFLPMDREGSAHPMASWALGLTAGTGLDLQALLRTTW